MMLYILLLACAARQALGHGAMVYPRPRNSIDAFANVTAKDRHTFAHCANITGDACNNGQSAFWCVHVYRIGFLGQYYS